MLCLAVQGSTHVLNARSSPGSCKIGITASEKEASTMCGDQVSGPMCWSLCMRVTVWHQVELMVEARQTR